MIIKIRIKGHVALRRRRRLRLWLVAPVTSDSGNSPCNRRAHQRGSPETCAGYDSNKAHSARRDPDGKERVYTVSCSATDASGNSSSGSAVVTVPGEPDNDEDQEDR